MNVMTNETEAGTERLFYIESKSSASTPRLISARSASAAMQFLALETWTRPRPAKVADMKKAMGLGAKIEKA